MVSSFIVFEGITGSGKKTQVRLLAERLQNVGERAVTIGFPNYETQIARLTRRIMDADPFTLSLLFAADRSIYQERIKALLKAGEVVLCDRYSYSNFAYMTAKGLDLSWLIELERNILKPNIVFLIDVPVSVSFIRVQQLKIEDFTKKEILSRIEREKEVMERIREIYLNLVINNPDKETKWFVIDGSQNIEKIHEDIWKIITVELKIVE
jgi:dTMP kinase